MTVHPSRERQARRLVEYLVGDVRTTGALFARWRPLLERSLRGGAR
jgi:hypothetical protein